MQRIATLFPGLAFCAVVGLASAFIADHYGGPTMLYALLIGMTFHHLSADARFAPGIQATSKQILRLGVALLGIRISVEQIMALGATPVIIVLIAVPATIVFGLLLSRWLGMSKSQGVLTGGSVAICGASAAMAIAAVLPQRPETERQLIFTVVGVTTLSTIAMIAYPLITNLLQMNDIQAGFFLGGTIHDVAQVVGAGYMISDHAGDTATFTKLLRVAVLAPAVLVISISVVRGGHASSGGVALPGFLIAFIALVIANSLGWVPEITRQPLENLSRACLVAAIAAIGVKASFKELAELGWRPVLLITAETLFLAGLVLAGLYLLK